MSTRYSSHYDPDYVQELAFSILKAQGRSPNGKNWTIEDLCILLDWMHENIRYEKDRAHYGQNEYIATPAETLKARCGDCEDHALLFGSMCLAIGAGVRMALVPGHAFSEVCLGSASDLDMQQVVNSIGRYLKRKSRSLGAKTGQVPFCQGDICEGWTRSSDGIYSHTNSYRFHKRNFTGIEWVTSGGKVYLPVDDCFAMMYIGDCKRLSKYRNKAKGPMWIEVTYEYPPDGGGHGSHPKKTPPTPANKTSPKPAGRPKRRSNPSSHPARPRAGRGHNHLAPLALLLVLICALGWYFARGALALDVAGCLVVAWFAWRGYEVGLFEQVGRLASWVVPIIGGMWALEPLDALYQTHIGVDVPLRRYLLFGGVAVILFGTLRLLLKRVADGHNSSALDGLMGTLTGGLTGAGVVYGCVLAGLLGSTALAWSPPVAGSYAVAFTQTFNVLEQGRLDTVKELIDEVGGAGERKAEDGPQ